ncbi:MAG: insulinase family protein [Helicobacteraceae bacterium]|jgi:predicted Zn-dependent peptidase|nr:insulinase family protein [Helicobacteraceae bacterium]
MAANLPAYEIRELKNGLKIVAVVMKNGSEVMSVDLFYKVGSRNETMGMSGMAHMLEHLSFKSTKRLAAGEYDREIKKIGGVTNASTGFDYTHYFVKTSAKNLRKPLELFAEMMTNLALKDDEFQTERQVVREERLWRTDNSPQGALFFALFNNAFHYHPYHWTPIGFMGDIEGWKIEDIRAFYRKWYSPQNAVLIASGDFDKEEFFAAAEKYFGGISNVGDPPKVAAIEPEQQGARRAIVKKESEVELLAIAWKIPPFGNEDSTALESLAAILSEGQASRLEETLADKLRLVNSIDAFAMELNDSGLFVIIASCNANVQAELVEKEILNVIAALQKKLPSDREVAKIKTLAKSSFIRSLETSDGVSGIFGHYLSRGDLAPLLKYEENIEKLTARDITNAAKKYLIADKSTTIILRSK